VNINQPSEFLRKLYYSFTWRIENNNKELFLTFDDGPTPIITEWVLNQLDAYNAKATFFCIGRNVDRHPEIYEKIKEKGHAIGNHTYSHLKGWMVSTKEYIDDIELASHHINTKLFRPPYGKIKPSQIKNLKRKGYKLFMWDVLSEDYNSKISTDKCLQNITDYTREGSIIVFHDSLKASRNLKKVLPEILKKYTEEGFIFQKLK